MPNSRPLRRAVHASAKSLKTAWCIVGVSLLAIVAIDFGLRLLFFAKDTLLDKPQKQWWGVFQDYRSDDGQAEPWQIKYEKEYTDTWREEWHSYIYWRRPPYHGECINIDADGIRRTWQDPLLAATPKTSRKRVFVFGGSTIWGTGARDDYTIPSFLAKQLADHGVSAEVINFGESGYVSTQEVLTLLLRLQRDDIPDLVVFYDGFNDTFMTYQGRDVGAAMNESHRRAEFNLLKDPSRIRTEFLKQIPEYLQGFTRVASGLRRRLGDSSDSATWPSLSEVDEQRLSDAVIQNYDANIRIVESLGASYGFACRFFWQPDVFTKLAPADSESARISQQQGCKRFFLATHAKVRHRQVLSNQSDFEDISAVFDDVRGPVFLDFAHVTEEANRLIAQRMLPAVAATVKIDR